MTHISIGISTIAYRNTAGEYASLTRAPKDGKIVDVVEATPDIEKATTFLSEELARMNFTKRELLADFKPVRVDITFSR